MNNPDAKHILAARLGVSASKIDIILMPLRISESAVICEVRQNGCAFNIVPCSRCSTQIVEGRVWVEMSKGKVTDFIRCRRCASISGGKIIPKLKPLNQFEFKRYDPRAALADQDITT